MTDQPATRKDGRKLYYDSPVTAMDEIEYMGKVEIPEGAITCRGSREDDLEAWMFDD